MWSVKCRVGSVEWEVGIVESEVYSVKCGVWSVNWGVGIVECKV